MLIVAKRVAEDVYVRKHFSWEDRDKQLVSEPGVLHCLPKEVKE
jgi:hypothetical protein